MALINHVCLLMLAIFGLTGALIYTKAVLLPFVFSIFFYAVLTPLIRLMQSKLKLSKGFAVLLTLMIFLAFFSGMILILAVSVEEFFQSADLYQEKIADLIAWSGQKAQVYGYEINVQVIKKYILGLPIFSYASNLTGIVFSFLGNSILVMIFVLFLILGESKNQESNSIKEKVVSQISSYIGTKTITSMVTGILVGVILFSFDVDLALMFATLTFALNFIPNIGSIVATLLPLPVLVLQFGLGWKLVAVICLCTVLQATVGNYVEPKMMGESLDLHPVTILLFLMFWGLVWGLAGLFLAVPITAIVKMIFSRIETTHVLAEILAGRLPDVR